MESIKDFDILGVRLVDPAHNLDEEKNLYVRKGIIYHEKPSSMPEKIFHLNGLVVVPGLLDLRVHTRVPGGENIENIKSVTGAASKGGFTGILAMPDTSPKADNPGTIQYIRDRINQSAVIDVFLSGCLTMGSRGERIAPLGSLKEAGVIAVTDCPYSRANNQIFMNSVHYAKMFGLKVIEFPNDPSLSHETHAHQSAFSLKLGLKGEPRIAEELMVQRAIAVSQHLDTPIHVSSLSSEGSVNLIEEAKSKGIEITADVSAHHLFLNEKSIEDYNTNAKTTPFLREEGDRKSLISGLKSGVIDACTSSHEPISSHLKEVEYDKAPSGVTGLETAASIMLKALNTSDPFPQMALSMSSNPHKILGIPSPSLCQGRVAQFTVIDSNASWVYHSKNGQSLSSNSPFENMKFKHQVKLTVNKGKIVWSLI